VPWTVMETVFEFAPVIVAVSTLPLASETFPTETLKLHGFPGEGRGVRARR